MTRPVLICGAGIAGLWAAFQLTLATPAQTYIAPAEHSVPSEASCPRHAEDSRPQPSGFDELFITLPELAPVLSDESIHCRHVVLQGHFRAGHRDGYAGSLYSSVAAAYADSPDRPADVVAVFAFEDPSQSFALNGATLTLAGYAHPVCLPNSLNPAPRTARDTIGPSRLQCREGEHLEWGLEHPTVVSVDTRPGQFLTGESRRDTVGQLRRIEMTPSAQQEIETIWSDFVLALPSLGENQNRVWNRFLAHSEISPLRAPELAINSQNIVLFDPLMLGPEPDRTITCLCTTSDCSDKWPLFEIDTRYAFREFVCMDLYGFPTGEKP
jgi:hypothetical protein